MQHQTGIALAVLALIALGEAALAEDAGSAAGKAAAAEAEWQTKVEARLDEDAKAIAADAMSAALKVDLSATLALEQGADGHRVLALASQR